MSQRIWVVSCFSGVLLLGAALTEAQTAAVQSAMTAKYSLTKATADRSDIVTAGDVLVLQKDGLLMCGVTSASPADNTYKNGKISQGMMASLKCRGGFSASAVTGAGVPSRKFVSGEKFWVTSVDARGDSVVFGLFSDPVGDTRYYATLKVPVSASATPAEVAAIVDQVVKVQPGDAAAAGAPGRPAPPPSAPLPPPPPPVVAAVIAPPPPPAPDPIQVGETKAAVTAAYGQPTKVLFKSATKEIDAYPGIKVTFVRDKVTDVE